MVRYPHTATVAISDPVTIANGEYTPVVLSTSSITGRLESAYPRRIKTINGDWVESKLRFFTLEKKIEGATSITVDGVEYRVLTWMPYQTYSEIWLD